MEIHLPPKIEEMLNRHIESGRYESPTQAICQAIFLLDELAEWEDENFSPEYLRKLIQEETGSGPSVSGPEFFAEWRKELAGKRAKLK